MYDAYYFPLTAADTYDKFDIPLELSDVPYLPQSLSFYLQNQNNSTLTFTAVYLTFLIQ